MGSLSLRQLLSDLRFALPAGFSPAHGIGSLLPHRPASLRSLIDLAVFQYDITLTAGSVELKARIMASHDGDYTFSGQLKDDATIFGDQYTTGFIFNYHDAQGIGLVTHTGSIGASSSDHFVEKGKSIWIQNNWSRAFNGGVHVQLDVTGDEGTVIKGLLTFIGVYVAIAPLLFLGKGPDKAEPDDEGEPVDGEPAERGEASLDS
jgi:hypothetical protein